MSDQRTAKNLRLEDDEGESGTYIRLEDTGKDLADRWRLQAGETPSDWQPVEYDRPSRGGGGWILPLLIGAIVVGVAVPLLYFGVTRLLDSSITATVPDGDNVAVTAENQDDNAASTDNTSNSAEPAVVLQATDTPAPEAIEESTEIAPDVEPTAMLVEEEVATINSQYGVNARLEPNTTADVLRVLEQDEEVTILDRLNDEANDIEWLQVLTSEDAEVWVSSAFVDISTRLVAEEGGEVVEVAEAVEAPTITEPVVEGDDPVEEAPAAANIDVTISSPAGLNARVSPAADSEVVSILADGETLTAIQRSDDDQWVLVELDDGQTGWVFVQLVVPSDDLSALPSTSEAEAAIGEEASSEEASTEEASSTEPAVSETGEDTAGSDDETPAAPAPADPEVVEDAASESGSSISVVVASQYGVNARSTSSTEGEVLQIVDGDTELTAIGRTEDSTWIQAPLGDGTLGWIFTEALTITDDISTLPVVTPPAVGEPAETLPEPLAAPADGSDGDEADDAPADTASVETSGGITSTVPISLTVAVTATTESTTTLPGETDPVTTTVSITGTEAITSTIDTSVLVTTTEAITSTGSVTGTGVTVDGITATVVSLIDAKARPIPSAGEESIQGIPNGVVLSAIGRSANNFWVQVELADGTPAWVFANNVSLSVDISELPEVTPEQ